ncbi:MAG: hypothetical protein K0S40_1045, partial [Actinomycetospora sp.]|nr:hypothetical protein [Actinomycetospora sp.]
MAKNSRLNSAVRGAPAPEGGDDLDVADAVGVDPGDVVAEDDEVGREAGREPSADVLVAGDPGGVDGVGAQRGRGVHGLAGAERPSVGRASLDHRLHPAQGVPVGDARPVRAGRHAQAGAEERGVAVEQVGTVVADGRGHRVPDLVQEARLGHGRDAEGGQAGEGGVVDDPGVLQAVPRRAHAGPGPGRRVGEGVERGVHGPVTDGVRGDRPAALDGLDQGGVQDLRVVAQVARVVAVGVGRAHRRGARAQRPVEEDLGVPDAQVEVPEARAQAQVEAATRPAGRRVQDGDLGHEVDTHGEVPALAGELVGGELARGAPDPPAGDAGLGDVRQALAGEDRGGPRDRVRQLLDRVGPQEVAGQRLRRLEQDAGRLARLVADQDAAGGDRGRAVENARAPQDLGGDRADVRGPVLEPDRPPAAGAVERVPVRRPAEGDVVVAAPDHEGPVREPGGARGHRVVDGAEVAQPAERDLRQRLAEPRGVLVGVVEPGDHRRAPGTDDPACAHAG